MAGDGQMHQISAEIGGLKAAVEAMTRQWSQQEDTATEGRRKLHEKFELFRDEVRQRMDGLSRRVDKMAEQMLMIEPSIKAFNDEKLRTEGAKRLGKLLIGALVTAAGALGWAVHEFIVWFFKH